MMHPLPTWPPALWRTPEGTAIERTQTMLARLSHPEKQLNSPIILAGTNGKGSVLSMIRAILIGAAYHVHSYTTPHLQRFNERIVLNGTPISDAYLEELLTRCRHAAGELELEFFEGTTALALLAFAESQADYTLLEVGCGGRDDAVNVIPDRALSVITTISYDHMEVLGHRLPDIAKHKLGILREGVPAVIGYQPPDLHALIIEAAEDAGAPIFMHGMHWTISQTGDGMRYEDAEGAIDLPLPNLLGTHQILNAGCAIAAIRRLPPESPIAGETIAQGLQNIHHPGRLERIAWEHEQTHPLYFDGGHNLAAAVAIAESLKWLEKERTILIFGTTQGKDVSAMLMPFAGQIEAVYGVQPQNEPLACSLSEIEEVAETHGLNYSEAGTIETALDAARAQLPEANLLIFGSLFMRGEVTS